MKNTNRIVLILPYYGKLPPYFAYFLKSVEGRCFDVLFISDCNICGRVPPNFIQIRLCFNEFVEKIRSKLEFDIALESPYKLCDYKPLYGYILEEYIKDYEYFAFGDCDVVFGKKMDEEIARLIEADYDVMSFRKHWISGSFCILKNKLIIRELPFRATNLKEILQSSTCQCFDELCGNWFEELKRGEKTVLDCERVKDSFSAVVWRSRDIKFFHEDLMCENALVDAWIRVAGERVWLKREEVPAFHFINAKRSSAFASGWNGCGLKSQYVISRLGRFSTKRIPWWGAIRIPISRLMTFCRRAAKEGFVETIVRKVAQLRTSSPQSGIYVGVRTIPVEYLFSNYGTFLQHFALREKLKAKGFKTLRLPRKESWLDSIGTFRLCKLVARVLKDLLICWNSDSAKRRIRSFVRANKFMREFKSFIGRTIDIGAVDRCRIAIAGSDQVFSGYDGYNFLTDVPQEVPVISFAASADWTASKLSDDWRRKAQSSLRRYRAISVREEDGASLVKELLGERDIPTHCDPVMLLTADDYRKRFDLRTCNRRDVLLCYFLNLRSKDEINFNSLRRYSQDKGLKLIIVASDNTERFIPKDLLLSPSPKEFLQMFEDAELVVTNSFHGTVLSMIFNRRFITLYQKDYMGSGQNVRIESILKRFSLLELATDADTLPRWLSRVGDIDCDWVEINSRVQEFASRSEIWLYNQLGRNLND